MSLAERCYRLARRHDKAVRYAIARAQHPLDEALRNYLLLVSRAHGLHPTPVSQPDTQTEMMHGALGGDHAALAMLLDHLAEQGGREIPSASLLHEAPVGGGGLGHLIDLLAGLHHRSLGTGFHEHPLPVEQMFGGQALASTPDLERNVRRRLPFAAVFNLIRGLPQAHAALGHDLDRHATAAGNSGSIIDLPPLLDSARRTEGLMHASGNLMSHGRAQTIGNILQDMLGAGLGLVEHHHGLGG